MGLFQQRPEEQDTEWALPSEPIERAEAEVLPTTPTVDPLSLGMGLESGGSVTSIVFPAAPPAPEAVTAEDREPED
ncbi:hypothetical protein [uncultured Microbacterium sp.]|uniref:hypothetical protein n=1 Tax=uncultured Microbacterium sp. TaxID=191216 RepID=UPI0028D851E1|nr:hypothetical protein [uncultured Microbacterium sp.]